MDDRAPTRTRRDEGFTLVEVMIVLLIIAITLSIGLYSISSARRAGGSALGRSTAHAYAKAIEDFALDHNGRYPAAPPSDDWKGGSDVQDGPIAEALVMGSGDAGATTRRYLRRVPESVQDGTIVMTTGSPPPEPAVWLAYASDGPGFRIDVHLLDGSVCSLRGGGATSTTPVPCASR